jgi:hypothetical protein
MKLLIVQWHGWFVHLVLHKLPKPKCIGVRSSDLDGHETSSPYSQKSFVHVLRHIMERGHILLKYHIVYRTNID